jgi:calcium-dependent protein kinase
MISAASYLHRMHVIHRDVKPENWLFVRRDVDTIKLCDFGSAVQLSFTRPRTHQLGGTIVYQAPEIHFGRGGGAPADPWGLGCVLYTMLVGRHPFKVPGVKDELCVEQICQGAFNRNTANWVTVPPAAQRVIESFITVDEKQRMSSSEAPFDAWVALGAPAVHAQASIRVGAAKALQLAKIVNTLDPLQRLVLVVCARLPPKPDDAGQPISKVPWYALYTHLDQDGDGRLCKSELIDGLAQLMGPSVHDDEVIDALDVDGNGFVDWAEWCMLELIEKISSDASISEQAEPWRSAHRLLDGPTGDGLISFHDLGTISQFGNSSECNKLLQKWSSSVSTQNNFTGLTVQDLQSMFKSIKRPTDLLIM